MAKTKPTKAMHPEFLAHAAFYRQLDFFMPLIHNPKIVVVGAGGIGSWTVLQLAKLGVRDLTVYDNDRIEVHNVSTTPYSPDDIGKRKVHALAKLVKQFGVNAKLTAIPEKFTPKTRVKGADIVISAVDGRFDPDRMMWLRQDILAAAVRDRVPFFIDGRIGGEGLRVYSIDTTNQEWLDLYPVGRSPQGPPDTLPVSPEFAAKLPCVGEQVIDVGWVTSSLITRGVRKYVVDREYIPEIIVKMTPLTAIFAEPLRAACTKCDNETRIEAPYKDKWHKIGHVVPKFRKAQGFDKNDWTSQLRLREMADADAGTGSRSGPADETRREADGGNQQADRSDEPAA